MPRMDGLEATRRIRALGAPERAAVPIIAMTAHALKGNLETCLEAGMNDYVAKPIDPDRLFAALRRWIAQADPATATYQTAQILAPEPKSEASILAKLNLPGIDIKDGLSRANGNPSLYLKMLRSFRDGQTDAAQRAENGPRRRPKRGRPPRRPFGQGRRRKHRRPSAVRARRSGGTHDRRGTVRSHLGRLDRLHLHAGRRHGRA